MMVAEDKRRDGASHPLNWMEIFYSISTFTLFNLLWVFGALLVVTIPAMTAALFAGVAPWTRGQSPYQPFTTFGKAIQRYWLKATIIALFDLIGAGFILLNLLILRQMEIGQIMVILTFAVTIFATLLLILVNVYLWPLLVTMDLPLRDLLKSGIRLAILHPLWGLLVAVVAAIPSVLSLVLPGFFMLTLTFAATAFIVQWGAWRIIHRYLDESELHLNVQS